VLRSITHRLYVFVFIQVPSSPEVFPNIVEGNSHVESIIVKKMDRDNGSVFRSSPTTDDLSGDHGSVAI
jgi:hypothetical protein